MNRFVFRSAAVMASLSSLVLAATPAMARDRWGGWGGYGGWGGWGRHDRVDVGDVLAGVLIIGGIAAVANAASKAARDRRYDDRRYDNRRWDDRGTSGREYRGDDYRGTDRRYGSDRDGYAVGQSRDGESLNRAVDRCVDEVERGSARVESVDETRRDGNGWRVEGRVAAGSQFSCTVDTDGRIRGVAIDGRAL